jgi:hypothetical protein
MNTMPNPQPLGTRRTRGLALAAAAALLLALALLSVAMPPRPAEAYPYPDPLELGSKAPTLSVSKSSVVVDEGRTATNSGAFDDSVDDEADTVRVSTSVGTITQSSTGNKGTWSWSYATPNVSADQTTQVTITARDSTGLYTRKVFSLTVKNVAPPVNDMFSSALDLATVGSSSTTTGYTTSATMEVGEPRPYSPAKDCGIYGVSNSVWFKFTYGGQGGLPPLLAPNAYYNFDTQGSNFDTVLALYEGSSVDTLKQMECSNDNSLPNWNDNLSIPQTKLSVGKTYYVQLTGTGGARSGNYQLRYEPRGLLQPKVMAYNIGEGKVGQGGLPAVASTIRTLNPDIVLLNEVRKYDAYTSFFPPPNGVSDQTKWLAEQTGFPYYKYHRTAYTGLTGSKGVAILSQYPISSTDFVELPDENDFLPQWGILKATIEIDGLTHDVFSTRFPPAERAPGEPGYDPTDRPENELHHKQAIDIVRSIPSDHAVIFGGDLNASWSASPWAKEFPDNSGLTDVLVERRDPDMVGELDPRADYIYYRGPYSVSQTQNRNSESLGLPEASDHPYVFAHFLRDY